MSINFLFTDPQNYRERMSAETWNNVVNNGGGGGGGAVADVTNSDNNLLITPSTGNVVVDLEQDVSIKNSLVIGNSNATGEFIFDTNGNLTLPLNSNTNGSTFIRAGDNTGTSTNAIDMFCNWNSNTGVYGGECFLSNTEAYIGINGVSNSVTNYVGVDNTSSPNTGTFKAQVVGAGGISSTLSMDTSSMLASIPKCNILLDNTSYADAGVFAMSSYNSVNGTTATITFKNDTSDGSLLSVGDLTATNINVNGAYNLATSAGAVGSVLTAGAGGTTSWTNPISIGAQYCNLSGVGTLPLTLTADVTWTNKVVTSSFTSDFTNITLPQNSILYVNAVFTGINQVLGGGGFQFDLVPANCTFSGNVTSQISNASVAAQTCCITGIIVTTSAVSPSIKFTYAATTVITNGGCSCVVYAI